MLLATCVKKIACLPKEPGVDVNQFRGYHEFPQNTAWGGRKEAPTPKKLDSFIRFDRYRRSYTVFICQQSYLLLLFGIPSPTHSFFPGLKPSFSANPSHCSPSFLLLKYLLCGFPGLFTCSVIIISIINLLLFLSISVFYF